MESGVMEGLVGLVDLAANAAIAVSGANVAPANLSGWSRQISINEAKRQQQIAEQRRIDALNQPLMGRPHRTDTPQQQGPSSSSNNQAPITRGSRSGYQNDSNHDQELLKKQIAEVTETNRLLRRLIDEYQNQ
jgi:hypothetical protein